MKWIEAGSLNNFQSNKKSHNNQPLNNMTATDHYCCFSLKETDAIIKSIMAIIEAGGNVVNIC